MSSCRVGQIQNRKQAAKRSQNFIWFYLFLWQQFGILYFVYWLECWEDIIPTQTHVLIWLCFRFISSMSFFVSMLPLTLDCRWWLWKESAEYDIILATWPFFCIQHLWQVLDQLWICWAHLELYQIILIIKMWEILAVYFPQCSMFGLRTWIT